MSVFITQQVVEVLRSGTPDVLVTQQAVEVLRSGSPDVLLTQQAVEVLVCLVPPVTPSTSTARPQIIDLGNSGIRFAESGIIDLSRGRGGIRLLS